MEYNLMQKGVKKEDIDKAFESSNINLEDSAFNLALKHIGKKDKTYENIQKTYRYLISKGYSYEQASSAISKIKIEED